MNYYLIFYIINLFYNIFIIQMHFLRDHILPYFPQILLRNLLALLDLINIRKSLCWHLLRILQIILENLLTESIIFDKWNWIIHNIIMKICHLLFAYSIAFKKHKSFCKLILSQIYHHFSIQFMLESYIDKSLIKQIQKNSYFCI